MLLFRLSKDNTSFDKIKGEHLQQFYHRIEEKHAESIKKDCQEDITMSKLLMDIKSTSPYGFLQRARYYDATDGSHLFQDFLRFLGYDLNDPNDVDFIQKLLLEEKTFKEFGGDVGAYNSLLEDYLKRGADPISWVYNREKKTLRVSRSGSGAMMDYRSVSEIPWVLSDFEFAAVEMGITRIGERAFMECGSLKQISLPKSTVSIGQSAFSDCAKLDNITIPEDVEVIEVKVFCRCKSLKHVYLSGKVMQIRERAFYQCTSLTSIKMLVSLKEIEKEAFEGCGYLTDVYYAGSEKDWNLIHIDENGNDALKKAVIHYEGGITITDLYERRSSGVNESYVLNGSHILYEL